MYSAITHVNSIAMIGGVGYFCHVGKGNNLK